MLRLTPLIFCPLLAIPAASNAGAGPAKDLVAATQSQIGVTLHYDGSYPVRLQDHRTLSLSRDGQPRRLRT
jgi:uncharacterized protein YijF (DUF1287 family)